MQERLSYLFKKFIENKCSLQEYNELLSLIQQSGHDAELKELIHKHFTSFSDGKLSTSESFIEDNGSLKMDSYYSGLGIVSEKPKPKVRLWAISLAAATISGILFLIAPVFRQSGNNNNPVIASVLQKSTSKAEMKFLLLSDSTQVWLNAASKLNFLDEFDNSKREVTLTGEAFFDVKHADKIPFIIHTGKITTTVLGTAFNIKAYPDQSSVTISVTRGKVKVTNGDKTNTLLKGQEIKINNNNADSTVSKEIEPEIVAAWQKGDLIYDEISLGDILKDLQNIYDAEIRIKDAQLELIKVTASFKRNLSIDQVLLMLCKLTNSKVKKSDASYYITDQN